MTHFYYTATNSFVHIYLAMSCKSHFSLYFSVVTNQSDHLSVLIRWEWKENTHTRRNAQSNIVWQTYAEPHTHTKRTPLSIDAIINYNMFNIGQNVLFLYGSYCYQFHTEYYDGCLGFGILL